MTEFKWNLQMFGSDYHATSGMVDPVAKTTDKSAYTDTEGLSVEMKTFYTEQLIRKQGPKLVHEQFGMNAPIPARKGDRAEFRYRKTLPKALKPLTEGITPDPSKMTIVPIYAEAEQYGDWLGYTDKLSLTAIDPIVSEMTVALSEQAGLTNDTVVREIINGGTNVRFAPKDAGSGDDKAVYSRNEIDDTCLITVKDVYKMAAILRAANAPTKDGYFVAIAHPYVIYDLMMGAPDKMWKDVMSYAKPENMLKGEVGEIGGVRFVSTSEAKIFKGELIPGVEFMECGVINGKNINDVQLPDGVSVAKDELAGKYINCYKTRKKIESNTAASAGGTFRIVVSEAFTEEEMADGEKLITSGDSGANGGAVFSTLFIAGNEAYGVVDIGGKGTEFIAKPLGSGNDQLNQRGSVGWKGYKGAVILHQEYLLRYESGSTMGAEVKAN